MTGGKILIDRAVLEQALEALEMMGTPCPLVFLPGEIQSWQNANEALRAALDQPQPLPSPVWRLVPTTMTNAMAAVDKELRHTVPWIRWEAILAAAPQPPRQPLTDEAEHQCPYPKANPSTRNAWLDGWEAAERAHGITGEQA